MDNVFCGVNKIMEAWSLTKCRHLIKEEVLSGKVSWQKCLERISDWQTKELAKHGNPPEGVAYIDQSLINIQQAAQELGIFDDISVDRASDIPQEKTSRGQQEEHLEHTGRETTIRGAADETSISLPSVQEVYKSKILQRLRAED